MPAIGYYQMLRQIKDPKLYRYELVRYAQEHGVKPAARCFGTTPKTVRKWLRRWEAGVSACAWRDNTIARNTDIEIVRIGFVSNFLLRGGIL